MDDQLRITWPKLDSYYKWVSTFAAHIFLSWNIMISIWSKFDDIVKQYWQTWKGANFKQRCYPIVVTKNRELFVLRLFSKEIIKNVFSRFILPLMCMFSKTEYRKPQSSLIGQVPPKKIIGDWEVYVTYSIFKDVYL